MSKTTGGQLMVVASSLLRFDRALKGIVPTAILLGFVCHFLLVLAFVPSVTLLFLIGGRPRVFENPHLELDVATTLVGLACTTVGGLIAASRLPSAQVKNASLVGILSIAAGFLLAPLVPEEPRQPWWLDWTSYVLTVPAAALGGYFAAIARADPTSLDDTP